MRSVPMLNPGFGRFKLVEGTIFLYQAVGTGGSINAKDFLAHVDASHRRIWADDHCLIYELIGDERGSAKEARPHGESSQALRSGPGQMEPRPPSRRLRARRDDLDVDGKGIGRCFLTSW
jgi:hypothetical protein